jgi:stage V sporulation protein S
VKSVAIARIYLLEDGIEITCVPMFVDVEVGGNERTAVRIEVTGHGGAADDAARLDVD